MDLAPDLDNVDGVVVAVDTGVGVFVGGVLPRLRQGAVVPDVAVVREKVLDIAKLAFLDVLWA